MHIFDMHDYPVLYEEAKEEARGAYDVILKGTES